MRLPAPSELASILWGSRGVLLVSTIVGALVAVPIALREQVATATAQVLVPAKDPVSGTDSKGGTSVVAIKLAHYASEALVADVRRMLKGESSNLISLSATRERNPVFFRLNSSARTPELAVRSLEVTAQALIGKSNALAQQQLDALSKDTLSRIEELRKTEAPLRTEESAKQAELDSLLITVRNLDSSLVQARSTVDRAQIVGNFASRSAAQAIAANLQKEIDSVAPQIQVKKAELDTIEARLSVISGERESLEALLQTSTRQYVSSLVTSVISEPPSIPANAELKRAAQTAILGAFAGLLLAAAAVTVSQTRPKAVKRAAPRRLLKN